MAILRESVSARALFGKRLGAHLPVAKWLGNFGVGVCAIIFKWVERAK